MKRLCAISGALLVACFTCNAVGTNVVIDDRTAMALVENGFRRSQRIVESQICARAYLGDGSYGYNAQLDAQYDYPQVPAERDKCNIFVAHRLAQCGMRISIANTILRRWPPPRCK